ncbi:lipid-transfer protein [Rhodococcus koreensis]|uniref:propanoyl-CoA C-acyltransferase n=1 Tax=Rhodococcus koreensis TaxID=99653 RepID=A0A1H4X9R1_9NOCA|nr:lipid-transfer protein [Rhodococcus koreensis]SED02396.1 Acetyl-CoA acetyltransferase [Rhodococcus koreensis]
MGDRVHVVGVGMVPFTKPGKSDDYDVMGERAARAALEDAGVAYELVQHAYVGFVYGDSCSGQRAVYRVGLTGVPVVNVNNNCATGSTALWLARQAVASGAAECVLAVGFEQMRPGALSSQWTDRPSPMGRVTALLDELHGQDSTVPMTARLFGGAGMEYLDRYSADPSVFAKVAVKSRSHAANNPYSVFRDPITEQQVLESPHLFGPVTRLQACPPTCGAAAAVVCSEEFARRHSLRADVVISAQAMVTDKPSSFESSMIQAVGADLTSSAAHQVYEAAGVDPRDIAVVELHDCFTVNEVLCYEALGLTGDGESEKFVLAGDNTYGGQVVVNPSGGLMSKGHPLGATGLAQCAELVWQLRGEAGPRQVDEATLALQHNLGLGGAGVVTLYEKVS